MLLLRLPCSSLTCCLWHDTKGMHQRLECVPVRACQQCDLLLLPLLVREVSGLAGRCGRTLSNLRVCAAWTKFALCVCREFLVPERCCGLHCRMNMTKGRVERCVQHLVTALGKVNILSETVLHVSTSAHGSARCAWCVCCGMWPRHATKRFECVPIRACQ